MCSLISPRSSLKVSSFRKSNHPLDAGTSRWRLPVILFESGASRYRFFAKGLQMFDFYALGKTISPTLAFVKKKTIGTSTVGFVALHIRLRVARFSADWPLNTRVSLIVQKQNRQLRISAGQAADEPVHFAGIEPRGPWILQVLGLCLQNVRLSKIKAIKSFLRYIFSNNLWHYIPHTLV